MDTKTPTAGQVLKAMKQAERTQSWTAIKAGFSGTTFNRKLNGGADFTVSELARIAAALNVHPADLLPQDWNVEVKAEARDAA